MSSKTDMIHPILPLPRETERPILRPPSPEHAEIIQDAIEETFEDLHRWTALGAFFLFVLIHNTDKLLLGPLATPIMETFQINEAQMDATSTVALTLGTTLAGPIGWRNIYYATGLLGILLAVVIYLFVKDPPRGNAEPELANIESPPSFRFSWNELRQIAKKPSMIFLLLQGFFGVLPWTVLSFWIYRYLEAERGFAPTEVLITMGIVILVMLAPFFAGLIAVDTSLGQAIILVSLAWFVAGILIAAGAFFVPHDNATLRRQMQERTKA